MSVIADTVEDEIIKLKGDYVLVVWGGWNDIGKNNSKEALIWFDLIYCNFVHWKIHLDYKMS